MTDRTLLLKYNVAVPRYTSYPAVPDWDLSPSDDEWKQSVSEVFTKTNSTEGISIYIHIPFCEKLCTYCGCHTFITKNHSIEKRYIEAILKEWKQYLQLFSDIPLIREIHLGGGTPTFLSAESLQYLIKSILQDCLLHPNPVLGFEAHPNHVNEKQLLVLYNLGFRRMSLGIQDFDPEIQRVINREQSFESVKKATDSAKKIGYTSINFDLIYGLPFQTVQSIEYTFGLVNQLKPDRIAFYSYAHVPWKKPSQRLFTEADLPSSQDKLTLFETGRKLLGENGYFELGIDHFALQNDELFDAFNQKTLNRSFMGYIPFKTSLLIGLGVSSISDSSNLYSQNEKDTEAYYKKIEERKFPLLRGHILTNTDKIMRFHIHNLMCKMETSWHLPQWDCEELHIGLKRLTEMIGEGLITPSSNTLKITEKGRCFVRNVCALIDPRINKVKPHKAVYSKSI